jgi:hypothetical protein
MIRHTPGPWKIALRDAETWIPKGTGIFSAEHQVASLLVVGEETMANAHLIAASPDLLKALKEAINVLESRFPEWEQTHFRKVLAKAEGKV